MNDCQMILQVRLKLRDALEEPLAASMRWNARDGSEREKKGWPDLNMTRTIIALFKGEKKFSSMQDVTHDEMILQLKQQLMYWSH